MKKIINLILILTFIIAFMSFGKKVNAVSHIDSFGNYNYGYESQLDEAYYQSADDSSASSLRESLHSIIASQKKKYPYSDSGHTSDVYAMLDIIDQDVFSDGDYIYCLLTGKVMPGRKGFGSQGTNVWNREHIWAKTWGFPTEDVLPYVDLNHLRAADSYANSTFHNDRHYDDVSNNQASIDYYGQKYNSEFYEPRDCAKGDIARMIFYMDIRYEGDKDKDGGYELAIVENYKTYYGTKKELTADTITTLKNAGIISQSAEASKTGLMSVLSTLVRWHQEDPVDDFERKRNDLVYQYQGNRNPFIDHPEYANTIYNANYQDGYYVSYFTDDNIFGYVDNNGYQAGSKINKPNVNPQSPIGYQFVGWCLDEELNNMIDFDQYKINSNLNLYAKYEFIGYTTDEALSLLKIENCLKFNYDVKDKAIEPLVSYSTIKGAVENKNSGFKKQLYKSSDPDEIIDTYVIYDSSLFDIEYDCRTKANGYLGNNIIRLYNYNQNGTAFRIKIKDGLNIKIVDHDITFSSNSIERSITLSSDGKALEIKNTASGTSGSNLDIKNIVINYVSTEEIASKEITFDKMHMAYRVLFDEHLLSALEGYNVGLMINNVSYDLEIIDNMIYLDFEVNDFEQLFEVYVYISNDSGQLVNEANSNIYSVSTLADVYANDYKDNEIVSLYLEQLKRLAQ